jgi:hypothetical protein
LLAVSSNIRVTREIRVKQEFSVLEIKRTIIMNMPLLPDKMTIPEKLAAIELLWDDLCRIQDEVPSPQWHGKVLAEREKKLSDGEASFSDLNEAKKRIRKATQ